MPENAIRLINATILSMAAKQEILDTLESNVFKIDIFSKYIEILINTNLELLEIENSKTKYFNLINEYINGFIEEPDEIIKLLKENW